MDGKNPEIPRGTRRNRKITGYEEDHTFGRRNGRTYLSGRGGGRALKRRFGGDVELLFVGAEGKMEMEKVPALGYRIVGLPIAGLQRRMDWHNLAVPLKVLRSIRMAKKTIRDFGADAVVASGLRQRPGIVGRTAAGGTDRDPGAELLRGADEQDPGPEGAADLRRL